MQYQYRRPCYPLIKERIGTTNIFNAIIFTSQRRSTSEDTVFSPVCLFTGLMSFFHKALGTVPMIYWDMAYTPPPPPPPRKDRSGRTCQESGPSSTLPSWSIVQEFYKIP